MSNKPGFFRQLKDTQNYSTKFLIVLFSPNSGVTPILALIYLSIALSDVLICKHRLEKYAR